MGCRMRGEPDEDKALWGNADGEDTVFEGKTLRWGEFSRGAELGDLFTGWKGGPAHRIVCFDDVSVISV